MDRRMIECLLASEDNLLRQFANAMPGGFFIYRSGGDEEIVYANEAMFRIFGCDNEEEFREFTGNSFRGLVHPDDIEEVERNIRRQIEEHQDDLDNVEYRIVRKDGEVRWIEDFGYFVNSESEGDIFYVFVRDSTEKKHEQEKRIEEYNQELQVINQEHLRRLEMIEGLSVDYESIFYVNLDMDRIKAYRVSERFQKQFPPDIPVCRFTGFDADYLENWVYPDDRDIVEGISDPSYIRKKLADEKTFHVHYRVFRGGKPAYIQLRVVNVSRDDRVSQAVFGYRNVDGEILQEIRQKQLLANALEEAKQANNAKNRFLANMSHDIRTPMNAIIGFTELMKKHLDNPDKLSGYLDMVTDASDQLMQLLNDVLELSRLESGKTDLDEGECNLIDVVYQVQSAMLPQAQAKNITFSVDIFSLKHALVYAEEKKLSMILSYIVDNAVKYTDRGGKIAIVLTEERELRDNHAVYQIVVEDTGIGISEEYIEQVFDPFVREKNTTMSGIYGTGLGLTIVRSLVDMIGGKIEISSEVGKGSRFIISCMFRTLDLKPAPEQKPAREINGAGDVQEAKRILIVDDNVINLEIEQEVLREGGFQVETALDGSVAVEKVKQAVPGYYDLILMDIQMPVMDGYCATREIRRLTDPELSKIPIIAVSANTFEEDRKMSLECGMNEHLPKPVDAAHLYRMIRKYITDNER